MLKENQDDMDLYIKILRARAKLRTVKSPYNEDLILYFDNKLIGTYSIEQLKDLGFVN